MLIENYNQGGFTSANAVRYVRTDDTPQLRKDVSVVRKPATFSQANGYSIPEYRIVVRQDTTTGGDNLPSGKRVTLDLTIRVPLEADEGQFAEALGDLLQMVNDPGFGAAVSQQLFPVPNPTP